MSARDLHVSNVLVQRDGAVRMRGLFDGKPTGRALGHVERVNRSTWVARDPEGRQLRTCFTRAAAVEAVVANANEKGLRA